jgi:hypothetical protein
LLLGLVLRAYHYLRQPPMWHDEASVVVNVLDKNYLELLGPLRFDATGPPLFLWAERAVYLTLGESTLALRLLPFLASCGSLFLIAWLARRLLTPAAVPWAVLFLGCSEQMLWHTCEAKPYAIDAFVAVFLASVYYLLVDRPLTLRIVVLTLLAPLALLVSYPAVLVYGGLLVALAAECWRERRRPAWLLLAALTGVVAVCVGGLALGPGRAQETAALDRTWTNLFPDWQRPWTVPGWELVSFLEVCRYCFKPLGQTLPVPLLIGAVGLWRGGRRDVVLVLGMPVVFALVAALAHRYPFGGARIMAYAVPGLVLLGADGVPSMLAWVWARFRPAIIVVVLPSILAVAVAGQRVFYPWPVADAAGAANYIEANRLTSDVVIGNDWTHAYYFHRLGAHFTPAGGGVARDANRVWIVVTTGNDESRENRLHMAMGLVPPGWTPKPVAEFHLTTVVLASRP